MAKHGHTLCVSVCDRLQRIRIQRRKIFIVTPSVIIVRRSGGFIRSQRCYKFPTTTPLHTLPKPHRFLENRRDVLTRDYLCLEDAFVPRSNGISTVSESLKNATLAKHCHFFYSPVSRSLSLLLSFPSFFNFLQALISLSLRLSCLIFVSTLCSS